MADLIEQPTIVIDPASARWETEFEQRVTVIDTASAWREIKALFEKGLMDWVVGSAFMTTAGLEEKTISISTRFDVDRARVFEKAIVEKTPWFSPGKDYITNLSMLYPGTFFNGPHDWFLGGRKVVEYWYEDTTLEGEAKRLIQEKMQKYFDRILSKDPHFARGACHCVEIMPDGRVAADGDNRWGSCNIFDWRNVCKVSCGDWHTVGLLEDGTAVACGSNVNGQCTFPRLAEGIVDVSCGRFHTALLLENGKVLIAGHLEKRAKSLEREKQKRIVRAQLPIECPVTMEPGKVDTDKSNEWMENAHVGDRVAIIQESFCNAAYNVIHEYYVVNDAGLKVGRISGKGLQKFEFIKVTVKELQPLSQKRKGSKYGSMTIEVTFEDPDTRMGPDVPGGYTQTPVYTWPPVKRIQSIYDAVVGVTEADELVIDGFCPCSEKELKAYMGIQSSIQ